MYVCFNPFKTNEIFIKFDTILLHPDGPLYTLNVTCNNLKTNVPLSLKIDFILAFCGSSFGSSLFV